MMIKNINPKVIAFDGTSQFEDWPESFKNQKCEELAEKFPRSIHFVIEDTVCRRSVHFAIEDNKNCEKNCKSRLKAFFTKMGHWLISVTIINLELVDSELFMVENGMEKMLL